MGGGALLDELAHEGADVVVGPAGNDRTHDLIDLVLRPGARPSGQLNWGREHTVADATVDGRDTKPGAFAHLWQADEM
jgi:hypothetical protein